MSILTVCEFCERAIANPERDSYDVGNHGVPSVMCYHCMSKEAEEWERENRSPGDFVEEEYT